MTRFLIAFFFFFNSVYAENHLQFFVDAALKNNLKLNAERKNNKSIEQNVNISRSEFLPTISLSGDQTSSQSTNKTNQSGWLSWERRLTIFSQQTQWWMTKLRENV